MEQTFDKIQIYFYNKILIQLGTEVLYLNIIKARYESLQLTSYFIKKKRWKLYLKDQEQEKVVHSHHFYSA